MTWPREPHRHSASAKGVCTKLHGLAVKHHFASNQATPEQLKIGIKIEMEHTDDPKVARIIALDHLSEFPNYYTGLKKLEVELKNQTP